MVRRWLRLVSLAFLSLLFLGSLASAQSTTMAISQVFSAQIASSELQSDFIELFNLGSTTVNLSGWTLQIASDDSLPWTAIPLTGSVSPGQYFLVAGASGLGSFPLPAPDLSNNTAPLTGAGGRIALVNDNNVLTGLCHASRSDVVDFVTYGSSSACTSNTSLTLNATNGVIRSGGGCVDTGVGNDGDFTVVPPYPRNSSSPPNVCGLSASAALESFSVPTNGGVSITTAGTGSTLTVGSAQIQPTNGSGYPAGVAIFDLNQNNVLVTEAGVPATPLVQNALFYVEVNGAITTGIAITNPNNQDVSINFSYNNSNLGYYYPTDFGSLTIPANGQLARFVTELPYAFSGGIEGTIQMTASAPIGIVVLRGYTNQRNEFLVTTLPVIDLSAPVSTNPAYLAQFAAGGGWLTEVVLINSSAFIESGTLSFVSPAGQPSSVTVGSVSASSFSYSLAPYNSLSVLVTSSGAGTLTGSVNVTPSSGANTPVAAAVFSYINSNGIRVSEAGLIGVSGSAFQTYVEFSGTPGAVGSIESGLALVNTGAQTATINLQLMGLNGSTVQSGSISIPASGQISKFLDELFTNLPSTFSKGILSVSTAGSISMVGLRGRYNQRGDFLVTTVPPVNQASTTSAQLVFPHFADSGGYTTQFILYGPAGQSSSGNLYTLSPGGQPLPQQYH